MLFRKFFTLLVLFITGTTTVQADFHKWEITELFSSADGSIQFIELFTPANGQELLGTSPDGAQLSSTDGSTTHLMASFPNDLPTDVTAGKHFLIATTGFQGLAGFTPDYIMADGFLFIDGGTVIFADIFDPLNTVIHGALPTDGTLSLNVDPNTSAISIGTNSPTNFAGAVGSIDVSAVVPVPAAVWLFGSGLIGVVAVARRRKTQLA